MKFFVDKLLLWLNDGRLRTLQFANDKVNVITGNSKTGKTAILEIIDYCLCGSNETVVISQEHIAENVAWYGIRFSINDKLFTIARGKIAENLTFSTDYYFSQTGEIPDIPFVKIGEPELKSILDAEFSIDDELTISHGGKGIKKNTRLSYRYFLMFNTLSKDIVDNGKLFFDKLTIERYRNAWHQVFDLALGVVTPSSLTLQRQINDLEQGIISYEQAKHKAERLSLQYESSILYLIKKAKEAGLIDEAVTGEDAKDAFISLMEDGAKHLTTNYSAEQEYEKVQSARDEISLKLAKLERFKRRYSEYKSHLKLAQDSLSPINYIQQQFSERTAGEYRQFLDCLSQELLKIKADLHRKHPFELDVEHQIKALRIQLAELDDELSKKPSVEFTLIPAAQKLISLGEIRSDFNHIRPCKTDIATISQNIGKLQKDLATLQTRQTTIDANRMLVVNTLNEYIQQYIRESKDALDEYGEYNAWFDYTHSALSLKKNHSATVAQISSSSDHLFMHLCLFAGMHHMLLDGEPKYVPSYLIIDQPSRPYFNTETYDYADSETAVSKKDDWSKVLGIFQLWDFFFELILREGKHFQIIMLEHVSPSAWKECKHINLVAVFDGIYDALIPPVELTQKPE